MPAWALGQPIDSDRPGLLFAGSVVSPGRVQAELGPQVGWTGAESLVNVPTVVRAGLARGLELQVGHTLVNRYAPQAGPSEVGLGDLSVGVKTARPGHGARPGIAAVWSVGLPTGADAFTSGDPVVGLQVQATWAVDRLSLGGLVGYSRRVGEGPDASSAAAAVSLGVPLGGSWSTYVEAGRFPGWSGVSDSGTVGGGLTRLLGPRVQLDAYLNRWFSLPGAHWIAGGGVAVLF